MKAWRMALLTCVAPLFAADDQFLRWMDRIVQDQLSEREAATAGC